MSIDSIKAAEVYAQIAKAAAEAPRTDETADAPAVNFAELVKSAVAETTESLKTGETAASQVAAGKASLVDVVTAVSAAEVTLETAIAVRNRVIEAYQDILRMPI